MWGSAKFFNTMSEPETKNMWVAISCNKKNAEVMDEKTCENIILEALNTTCGNIGILITDDVMKYNCLATGVSQAKATRISRDLGDHFHRVFSDAMLSLHEHCAGRVKVFRWRDIASVEFKEDIAEFNELFSGFKKENFLQSDPRYTFCEAMDQGAQHLLDLRVPTYSPKSHGKRHSFIKDFVRHEVPMLANIAEVKFEGITYEGMIYPASDPMGMQTVTGILLALDQVLPAQERYLKVLHVTPKGSFGNKPADPKVPFLSLDNMTCISAYGEKPADPEVPSLSLDKMTRISADQNQDVAMCA